MSHVGNGEHDFDGLENLDPQEAEKIKLVRQTAREAIDLIEPFHINNWPELIWRMEIALKKAKEDAKIFDEDFDRRYANLCYARR